LTKSSSAAGAGHILASRYASSLIEVATQSKSIDSVEKDLASLAKVLSESKDLNFLISSPVYSKDMQLKAVQDIARKGEFHKDTINFLGVLTMNGRLSSLHKIISAFFIEMEKIRGVLEAKIVSAFPLNETQQKNLIATLTQKTGKSIKLDLQIDKALLGGMVVTYGSRMIDDSLKTKLSQLKLAMIGSKAA